MSHAAEVVTLGTVSNGRLDLDDRPGLLRALRHFSGRVEVRIGPVKKGQTDASRKYYHSVVVEAAMTFTGYSHDEQHDILKALHLDKDDAREGRNGQLLEGADGRLYVIGGSTKRKKLPHDKYWEYIDRCRQWILETFDYYVPDPDPAWRDKNSEAA